MGHAVRLGLLSLLAVVGFDLLVHAGILSRLYVEATPFLLPPAEAFRLIPVGYASLALLVVLLEWLMLRLRLTGARPGFVFGLKVGGLVWVSLAVGLASISTARPVLLAGWAIGQAVELGVAGAVVGAGLEVRGLRRLGLCVLAFFAACAILAIVVQNVLR